MKKSHIKTYIIVAILISIVGISIAYAALSQQLQIKTNTTVQSSQTSWNIVISKDSCSTYGGHTVFGTVEISGTTVTISNIKFQAPGDCFGCTFSIENKGEVKAKISSIDYKAPTFSGTGSNATADQKLINDNLWKIFRWGDPDAEFKVGDILSPGEKKLITLQYGIQQSMATLPTNPVTFSNVVNTINFEQA